MQVAQPRPALRLARGRVHLQVLECTSTSGVFWSSPRAFLCQALHTAAKLHTETEATLPWRLNDERRKPPSRSRSVCSPRGALPVSVQPRPAGSAACAAQRSPVLAGSSECGTGLNGWRWSATRRGGSGGPPTPSRHPAAQRRHHAGRAGSKENCFE